MNVHAALTGDMGKKLLALGETELGIRTPRSCRTEPPVSIVVLHKPTALHQCHRAYEIFRVYQQQKYSTVGAHRTCNNTHNGKMQNRQQVTGDPHEPSVN